MLKKKVVHVLALITLVVGIILPAMGQTARAADITSSINISNVNVTDGKGGTYNNGEETDKNVSYDVSMNWSAPNGTTIKAGDTASFPIPDNVDPMVAGTYNITDKNGDVIGSFTVTPGQKNGQITFTKDLGTQDISGSLHFSANGTTTHNQTDWRINKTGQLQTDGTILWSIAVNNPNLVHGIITDVMSDNQTYIDGSMTANTGTFDANNKFTSDGVASVTPSVDGNKITFTVNDEIKNGLYITYKTKVNDPSVPGTYSNTANLTGDGVGDGANTGAEVKVGGDGTGNATDTSSTTTSSTTDTTPTTDTSSTTTDTTPTTDTSSTTTTSSTTDTTPTTDTSSTTTTSSTTDTTPTTDTSSTTTTSSTTDTTPTTDTSSTTTSSSTTPSTSNPTNPNTDTSSTSTTSTDVPHSAKPDTDTDTTGTHTAGVPGVDNNGGNGGHTNGKLPQTGQKDTKGLTIIGTAMLLMLLAMFGYIKVRKFNK